MNKQRTENTSSCARCTAPLVCQANDIEHCACQQVTLTAACRDYLAEKFSGCLCLSCLQFFSSKPENTLETLQK